MRQLLLGISLFLGTHWVMSPVCVSAELSTIEERGQLRIAVKDNRYPLGYRDDGGQLQGFEIDIARRLALELLGDAEAAELHPVSNTERLNVVLSGEVDVAIAAITVTAQRQRIASFSQPYYLDGTGFATLPAAGLPLDTLESVAVLASSSTLAHVRYWLPDVDIVPAASYQEALALLDGGQVQALAADISVLAGWRHRYRLLDEVISVEPVAIAIPKGVQYAPLRRAINDALERWDDEGWLQDRAIYWGLQ